MASKITNKRQMKKLISLMNEHHDIARGIPKSGSSRTAVKEKWESFTTELNELGPPTRASKEWQRVWIHYKANLKRKLRKNKRNEVCLNPLEKSISHLICLETETEEFSNSRTFGDSIIEKESEEAEETYPLSDDSSEHQLSSTTRKQETSAVHHIIDERLKILREQAETQKRILLVQEKMEKTAYKQYLLAKSLHAKEMELKEVELATAKKKLKLLSVLFL